MTVTTLTTRSPFTGDGVTATFPFTFALQQASDLNVYVAGALQTLGSAYTVTPNGGAYPCVGGNVVFVLASIPPNFSAGLIIREISLTQLTQLAVEGAISEATLENVFDKAMMAIQQLQEELNRTLTQPVTSTASYSLSLPDPPVPLDVFRFNSGGSAIEQVGAVQAVLDDGGVLGTGSITTATLVRLVRSTSFNISAGEVAYLIEGSCTGTLPPIATDNSGRITIEITGAYTFTLARNADAAHINGLASNLVVTGPGNIVVLEDGTGWFTAASLVPALKYTNISKSAAFSNTDPSGSFYELATGSGAAIPVTLIASPGDGTVHKFTAVSGTAGYIFTPTDSLNYNGVTGAMTVNGNDYGVVELIAISGGWKVT